MIAWMAGSEAVEDFAGVRFDEGVRIGFVRGDVHAGRIEVLQVDRPDDGLGYPRGQGDRHPVAFAMYLVPGALAAQVCGVGEFPPRLARELVPLADEVVA